MNFQESGITLVEMMITLLISSIVMGAVFTAFFNQQKTYVQSEKIADIQQNLRAALIIMASEIREAGCDPTGRANAGIISASSTQIRFTRDIRGHAMADRTRADGDFDDGNEDIEFRFSGDEDENNIGHLGRQTDGRSGFQPIAENIQAIEFAYILEDGTTVSDPNPSQLNEIRAVQISVLARSDVEDPKFIDTKQYITITGTGWGPFDDHYKRRFASITIQCRNLGMENEAYE